jgi:hypothetical protein
MAFNYSPKVITDGLVLYLDAANQYSYVSGSTSWNDISRGGNNGTLVNGPTYSSANGGSIVFDGTNDYVSIPYSNIISTPTSFTLSIWVKILSTPAGYRGLMVIGRDTGTWYSIYYASGYFVMATSGGNVFSPNPIVIGNWYNVVFTAAGSTGLLYENGVQVQTRSYTPPSISTGSNFYIGSATSGMEFSNSNIALASEYNRALSATEVLQNYNATKTRFGL